MNGITKKPGKQNPVVLDAMAHLLLTASQVDFDAATTALTNKKQKDFLAVCAKLGISDDVAKALYKYLKDAVDDADWGWQ